MYGLVVIDRYLETVFGHDGQPHVHERGTGAMNLCDVGLDGTILL
jgi:hypothetical protein